MPTNYKDLREELDDLLYEMEVPKEYFHRLADLNDYINNHCNFHPSAKRAFEIIHAISPVKLIRFNVE